MYQRLSLVSVFYYYYYYYSINIIKWVIIIIIIIIIIMNWVFFIEMNFFNRNEQELMKWNDL